MLLSPPLTNFAFLLDDLTLKTEATGRKGVTKKRGEKKVGAIRLFWQ